MMDIRVSCDLFTGPEGVRDYRAHRVDDPRAVGIGETSPLQSLDSGYVLRPAPGATLETPRSTRPGEIGWGIPWLVDWQPPKTGQQIVMGDCRQLAEDRATHDYLGAWYPNPNDRQQNGSQQGSKGRVSSHRESTSRRSSSSVTFKDTDATGHHDDRRSVDNSSLASSRHT
ncbi:uncharacterized protein C4orf45 homolog isoform X2 [Physella acuta]|uniref:uncharacterized protein C4orf45 homolog isoform X2 n=1 Tax=Physella acuta TaxID=109671 RepID=UPI0027DBF951|nr:uncharacterized protein C4orf45 homolog isoform X2 [Physella acuta]